MLYLEHKKDNHYKFWEITTLTRNGYVTGYQVRYGRIGTQGQSMTRDANAHYIEDLIQSKFDKGYEPIIDKSPLMTSSEERVVARWLHSHHISSAIPKMQQLLRQPAAPKQIQREPELDRFEDMWEDDE